MERPFRNPGGWPRSLVVNDVELPLSDAEVAILREALELVLAEAYSGSRRRSVSALLHCLLTGEAPREPADLMAWRASVRAERAVETEAEDTRDEAANGGT